MFVAGDVGNRLVLEQGGAQTGERFILAILKKPVVHPFQLDANRVVVAIVASPVVRNPGMPGAFVDAHELLQFTAAPDEKMGRHGHALDTFKVRMGFPIQLVGKQALHLISPVLAGRQTDGVQHNQVDDGTWGSGAVVG